MPKGQKRKHIEVTTPQVGAKKNCELKGKEIEVKVTVAMILMDSNKEASVDKRLT